MAKAQEITELDCSTDALEGAAKVLRVRFKEIVELYQTSADFSDVDLIHDLRVATRRLRSALRDFAPLLEKTSFKLIKKDLKKIADALGKVRDEDVAVGALEKLLAESESVAIKEEIEILLQKRKTWRETAQAKLTERFTGKKIDDLRKGFAEKLDKTLHSKKPQISFKEFGKSVIDKNLREFENLLSALYSPFEVDELHRLRLRAKRLRYALKIFAACWEDECKQFAKKISEMQTLLGDLHDCDEWIENLLVQLREENLEKEKRETLIHLSFVFLERRTKNYTAALQLWSDWQAEYFLSGLKTMTL
jgi:CHAD domain-containing protein